MLPAKLDDRLSRLLLCALPIFVTWTCFYMIKNWHPTTAAYIWATITAIITLSATTLSLTTLFHPTNNRANRYLPLAFYSTAITGFSVAITRALLPWEEPGTGMGSPMAVLIGLAIYSFLGFTIITLPMIAIARRAANANSYYL